MLFYLALCADLHCYVLLARVPQRGPTRGFTIRLNMEREGKSHRLRACRAYDGLDFTGYWKLFVVLSLAIVSLTSVCVRTRVFVCVCGCECVCSQLSRCHLPLF